MIELRAVNKTYHIGKTQKIKAADNVDLFIKDGDMLAIVGASGAGKSTLLKLLGLVERADSGEYLLNGKDIAKCSDKEAALIRNNKISFIMQDFALISQFTVQENVELPLLLSEKKVSVKKCREAAKAALNSVGILDLANRPVFELSGGQRQRVAIARALINHTDIILADEPTGALDSKTTADIIDILLDLNKDGKTVIIVTHDMRIAKRCDRIIEISDGVIISDSKNS